jgi:integrase
VRAKELTEQQVLRLLDACVMPHVRLFVVLAFATAGRTRAILELTWDRVDFDAGTIDLRLEARQNPLSKASQKNRAKVPMNNLARAALLEAHAIAITDHVIEWEEAPVASIRTGFMAACRRAGLSGVTPHALRHTAASLALDADQPMELIARFLGHRDVGTTARIYARPSTAKLKGVADAVNLSAERRKRQ